MTRGKPNDPKKRKSGTEIMYGGVTRVASGLAGHNQVCWVITDRDTYYPKHCTDLRDDEKARAYAFEILAIRAIKKAIKLRQASGNESQLNETVSANTGIAGKEKKQRKTKRGE